MRRPDGRPYRLDALTRKQTPNEVARGRRAESRLRFALDSAACASRTATADGLQVPIDVAWIDDDAVIGVATLDPCTEVDQTTCPRLTAPGPATALLEVPAGALADVAVGDVVALREP